MALSGGIPANHWETRLGTLRPYEYPPTFIGKCRLTFPYMGEFKYTSLIAISSTTLCIFIQLIPRMTSIPCPLRIMRLVLKNLPE
jgi:hypothetical protein